ncbi:hypothetical protein [Merismopedia glauca]|nr:hypothetical protein [Merismopedia glauca]
MNKSPQECESLTDIRTEIDRIDREIISQLSKWAQLNTNRL